MGTVLFHSDANAADDAIVVGHHEGFSKCGFSMKEISFEGIHYVCDSVMSVAKDFDDLRVIVSCTVLDKAFNPTSPPGGLSTRELIYFLQRISMLRNFKGVQVVDCADPELRAKLEATVAKPL